MYILTNQLNIKKKIRKEIKNNIQRKQKYMLIKNYIIKGQNWVKENIFEQELYHYGVKGMKWGVRKQLHYKKIYTDAEKAEMRRISEEIRSGKYTRTINVDKQIRHTLNKHESGKSYLYGDLGYAQKLINELSGTGEPVLSSGGQWTSKERVKSKNNIGMLVFKNGKQKNTKNAMIIYSNSGTHIYPRNGR